MRLFVVFVCIFQLGLVGCSNTVITSKYHIVIDDSMVNGISNSKKNALIKNITSSIDRITQYLEISFHDTLRVYILENPSNEATINRLYIDANKCKDEQTIQILTTIAILPPKANRFEMLGFSAFMESKLVDNENSSINKYIGFQNRAGYESLSFRYLMDNDDVYMRNMDAASCAYLQTGLIYLYFDKHYGRRKVIELYKQGFSKMESIVGTPVDSIEKSWKSWVYLK